MMFPYAEAALRLVVALVLGAMVGFERESHGRSAGLRTHALVAVAMCLLMLISLDVPQSFLGEQYKDWLRIDPGRMAQGALAGIGFIGAGVVLKGRGSIRGVTTAASIWMVSAIGLTIGMGHYALALTTCAMSLVVLFGLRAKQLAVVLPRDTYTRLHISGPRLWEQLPAVEAALGRHRAEVVFVGLSRNVASNVITYRYSLRFPSRPDWRALTDEITGLPGVERVSWMGGLVP